jgi:hypothetical protein
MRAILYFFILASGNPVLTGEAYGFTSLGDCEAALHHPAVLASRPGQGAACWEVGE